MWEKIDEIFKSIEDIRDDINILLNIHRICPNILALIYSHKLMLRLINLRHKLILLTA